MLYPSSSNPKQFFIAPMMALIIVMLTYLFFPSVVPRCSRILYTGLLFLLVKMSKRFKIKWYWKWFLYLVVCLMVPLLLLYVVGLVSGPVLAAPIIVSIFVENRSDKMAVMARFRDILLYYPTFWKIHRHMVVSTYLHMFCALELLQFDSIAEERCFEVRRLMFDNLCSDFTWVAYSDHILNKGFATSEIIKVYRRLGLGVDANTLARVDTNIYPTVLPEGKISFNEFFHSLEEEKGVNHSTEISRFYSLDA